MKKTRLLSMFLLLAMIFSLFPAVNAAEEVTYQKASTITSGGKYVIVAYDSASENYYALTSTAHDGYMNNSDYSYSGLDGVQVTVTDNSFKTDSTFEGTVWTVTGSSSGYTISSKDGVLDSTYSSSTPKGGALSVKAESTETWKYSSNQLQGKNSTKYLTFDGTGDHSSSNDPIKEGSADLFTIRSSGDNVYFYEEKTAGGDETTVVELSPTTSNPTATASIKVGETLTLKLTNTSSNSDYTFTLTESGGAVTLSSTSIKVAKKNGTGEITVTGAKAGTSEISITNGSSSSARKAKLTVTVTGTTPGGETGKSLDIEATKTTATTKDAAIAIGEELTINVTHTSSAEKDFTNVVADTKVAQITSGASIDDLAKNTNISITDMI